MAGWSVLLSYVGTHNTLWQVWSVLPSYVGTHNTVWQDWSVLLSCVGTHNTVWYVFLGLLCLDTHVGSYCLILNNIWHSYPEGSEMWYITDHTLGHVTSGTISPGFNVIHVCNTEASVWCFIVWLVYDFMENQYMTISISESPPAY